MEIKIANNSDKQAWDDYVNSRPNSNIYHLFGWKNVIEKTYGHKTYYFMAVDSNQVIVGILPLTHMKHFIFGNHLTSIPYFDMGGILADDTSTEKTLLNAVIELSIKIKVDSIELRHIETLSWLQEVDQKDDLKMYTYVEKNSLFTSEEQNDLSIYEIENQKVRMIKELPPNSVDLMKSFNSKFRNKIKRPLKAGLKCEIGGIELLDDFYKVFLINMRDLGSPVHSKQMLENVFNEFSGAAKLGIVYKESLPISCIMTIGFKNILANPWASALREYANLRANTLQYWTMLEYACDNGYTSFDFGRSSPDEGTFRFKEKWGAKPSPLHWYNISMDGKVLNTGSSKKSKFDNAIKIWQKIPVSFTKILGPPIRKHISL